jgi:hypothetical protein
MKVMLDLFSGLGGASESFCGSIDWDVIRIENNPLLKDIHATYIEDVMDYDPADVGRVDLIWASPPCREFSDAYGAPGPSSRRDGLDFQPDMTLLLRTMEIIRAHKPQHWIIENVRGAQPYFMPFLGKARQIIGPFYLWGNFPYLQMPKGFKHLKSENDVHSANPFRSNIKAKIPIEISEALRNAVESHRSLHEWMEFHDELVWYR